MGFRHCILLYLSAFVAILTLQRENTCTEALGASSTFANFTTIFCTGYTGPNSVQNCNIKDDVVLAAVAGGPGFVVEGNTIISGSPTAPWPDPAGFGGPPFWPTITVDPEAQTPYFAVSDGCTLAFTGVKLAPVFLSVPPDPLAGQNGTAGTPPLPWLRTALLPPLFSLAGSDSRLEYTNVSIELPHCGLLAAVRQELCELQPTKAVQVLRGYTHIRAITLPDVSAKDVFLSCSGDDVPAASQHSSPSWNVSLRHALSCGAVVRTGAELQSVLESVFNEDVAVDLPKQLDAIFHVNLDGVVSLRGIWDNPEQREMLNVRRGLVLHGPATLHLDELPQPFRMTQPPRSFSPSASVIDPRYTPYIVVQNLTISGLAPGVGSTFPEGLLTALGWSLGVDQNSLLISERDGTPILSMRHCQLELSEDEMSYWRTALSRLGDPDWGGWLNGTMAIQALSVGSGDMSPKESSLGSAVADWKLRVVALTYPRNASRFVSMTDVLFLPSASVAEDESAAQSLPPPLLPPPSPPQSEAPPPSPPPSPPSHPHPAPTGHSTSLPPGEKPGFQSPFQSPSGVYGWVSPQPTTVAQPQPGRRTHRRLFSDKEALLLQTGPETPWKSRWLMRLTAAPEEVLADDVGVNRSRSDVAGQEPLKTVPLGQVPVLPSFIYPEFWQNVSRQANRSAPTPGAQAPHASTPIFLRSISKLLSVPSPKNVKPKGPIIITSNLTLMGHPWDKSYLDLDELTDVLGLNDGVYVALRRMVLSSLASGRLVRLAGAINSSAAGGGDGDNADNGLHTAQPPTQLPPAEPPAPPDEPPFPPARNNFGGKQGGSNARRRLLQRLLAAQSGHVAASAAPPGSLLSQDDETASTGAVAADPSPKKDSLEGRMHSPTNTGIVAASGQKNEGAEDPADTSSNTGIVSGGRSSGAVASNTSNIASGGGGNTGITGNNSSTGNTGNTGIISGGSKGGSLGNPGIVGGRGGDGSGSGDDGKGTDAGFATDSSLTDDGKGGAEDSDSNFNDEYEWLPSVVLLAFNFDRRDNAPQRLFLRDVLVLAPAQEFDCLGALATLLEEVKKSTAPSQWAAAAAEKRASFDASATGRNCSMDLGSGSSKALTALLMDSEFEWHGTKLTLHSMNYRGVRGRSVWITAPGMFTGRNPGGVYPYSSTAGILMQLKPPPPGRRPPPTPPPKPSPMLLPLSPTLWPTAAPPPWPASPMPESESEQKNVGEVAPTPQASPQQVTLPSQPPAGPALQQEQDFLMDGGGKNGYGSGSSTSSDGGDGGVRLAPWQAAVIVVSIVGGLALITAVLGVVLWRRCGPQTGTAVVAVAAAPEGAQPLDSEGAVQPDMIGELGMIFDQSRVTPPDGWLARTSGGRAGVSTTGRRSSAQLASVCEDEMPEEP